MIDGERDPQVLAKMTRRNMRAKMPDLAQALEGSFEDHAQMAAAILSRLDLVEQSLA